MTEDILNHHKLSEDLIFKESQLWLSKPTIMEHKFRLSIKRYQTHGIHKISSKIGHKLIGSYCLNGLQAPAFPLPVSNFTL